MPYLLITFESQEKRVEMPAKGPFTIGRGKDCSFRVRDLKMSRVHLELTLENGAAKLTDKGSTNGTLLNGAPVKSIQQLKHGDLIQAGCTKIRFVEEKSTVLEPPQPPRPSEPDPNAATAVRPIKFEPKVLAAMTEPLPKPVPKPAQGIDFAKIVAGLHIVPQNFEREVKKGDLICASCRRFVTPKEVKNGSATNVHGQVCCPECIQKDQMLNTTIAGYRIDTKLGTGTWSVTYKAEQLSMARSVVLRVVKVDVSTDPELSTKFLAAVKRGGQISHPNLVRIYDIGRTDRVRYASVEFIDGLSVKRMMEQKKGIPLDKAIEIICDISSAMDVAHKRGVVHGDIRPSNIIVNDEGIPKLAGLGFAKSIEDAAATGAVRIEHPGESLIYSAPETLIKPLDSGKQADIYSLAAVLYSMISGKTPFDPALKPDEMLTSICKSMPKPVDQLVKDVPPRVSSAIAKAMAKEPNDRFFECSQFVQALRTGRS